MENTIQTTTTKFGSYKNQHGVRFNLAVIYNDMEVKNLMGVSFKINNMRFDLFIQREKFDDIHIDDIKPEMVWLNGVNQKAFNEAWEFNSKYIEHVDFDKVVPAKRIMTIEEILSFTKEDFQKRIQAVTV